MIFAYPLVLAIAIFAIGIAGIISSRHLIVMMLGIELMFAASIIALVSFFAFGAAHGGMMILLLGIWSVAIADTIAFVTFYVFIKANGMDFDIGKLSQMKW